MEIELEIRFTVDDEDDSKEQIAADIIEAEMSKFAAHVVDVLEQHGVHDVRMRLAGDDEDEDDELT